MKKTLKEKVVELQRQFLSLVQSLSPEKEVERAISMGRIYNYVWETIYAQGGWMAGNIYRDDDGSLFAILAYEGKLLRANVEIEENEIAVAEKDDWFEVEEAFPAVRARNLIMRENSDGTIRWTLIAATSVLNRNAEIDARELFDSFVEHIDETGEYPYITFFHEGEALKMGDADLALRDGNVYILTGLFDTDCALKLRLDKAIVKDEAENPGYWGASIGFYADPPEMTRITDDIEIPVYKKGINIEVSLLPENKACGLFTQMEVSQMKDVSKEELARLLDEEDVDALEESTDEVNREIDEKKLLTRDKSKIEPEIEPEVETEETPSESEETPEDEPEVKETDLILDREALQMMAEYLLESPEFKEILGKRDVKREADQKAHEKHTAEIEKLKSELADVNEKIVELKKDDDEHIQDIMDDMSVKSLRVRAIARPRNVAEEAPPTSEEIANETLSHLNE